MGGAIILPILLNIIVVDFFFGVAYGTLFSACCYLMSILWVCYLERDRVKEILRSFMLPKKILQRILKQNALLIVGIAIVFGGMYGRILWDRFLWI